MSCTALAVQTWLDARRSGQRLPEPLAKPFTIQTLWLPPAGAGVQEYGIRSQSPCFASMEHLQLASSEPLQISSERRDKERRKAGRAFILLPDEQRGGCRSSPPPGATGTGTPPSAGFPAFPRRHLRIHCGYADADGGSRMASLPHHWLQCRSGNSQLILEYCYGFLLASGRDGGRPA